MTTETCTHQKPAFGCNGCINKDKRAILEKAVGMTEAPKCTECGGMTIFVGKEVSVMELYFDCTACGNEEVVEVRR